MWHALIYKFENINSGCCTRDGKVKGWKSRDGASMWGQKEKRDFRGGQASRRCWRIACRGRDNGEFQHVFTWLDVRTQNSCRALSRMCVGHKREAQTESTRGLGALKTDPH